MRLALLMVGLALLLAPASVSATQSPLADGAGETVNAACAPPCGEINPRLLFSFDELTRDPQALAPGQSATYQGTLTFWFDADDEGYVPQDPQQPITVQFSFPRLPTWAKMSVEPSTIDVDLACATCFTTDTEDPTTPTLHYEQTFDVTLTVEVTGPPEKTPGYDYGKLQLFAKSTESGIYNPGYGIKEVRIQAGPGADLEPNSTLDAPAAGPLALLAALGATALAAARLARRD
ncbi:MAG: hypothetical protein R3185_01510 [Candidatus Thermoplasmatota archaeon]|nr:hypothetical protein [Candidatus Thermoplasmatota archaeon]